MTDVGPHRAGGTKDGSSNETDLPGPGTSTFFDTISANLDEAVGSASISPSGRDVCLASTTGLHIVDLEDPWATPRFLPHSSAIVADVQWSPHPSRSNWVISTSGTKALVFNLGHAQGNPIEHVCLGHDRSITDINWAVFHFDTLATCGIDGNVLCYDLRQGGRRPYLRYSGWRYGATQVKFNRQNPNEIASSHGNYVYLWDDRKGSAPVTTIKAHKQKIYGIDWNRKSRDKIVTCSLDRTIKYWHFDGSSEITAAEQTIETHTPMRRARHTPFGDGILTLPQRSENTVKFWSRDRPSSAVHELSGHHGVVREFLWRTKGGNEQSDDDREFQLVTWGNDRQLRMTYIPHSITSLIGHVPHSPIEVRNLRRHAENRTYRDISFSNTPKSWQDYSMGISGKAGLASPALGSNEGGHRITPPMTLHNPGRMPLMSTSRYSRSANSMTTGSASGSLGTSPADGRGQYLVERKARLSSSSTQIPLKTERAPLKSGTQAMTRGAMRRPGDRDAVTWMEGVRVVHAGDSNRGNAGSTTQQHDDVLADSGSLSMAAEAVPLHEEITAIARSFEGRVRFLKISVPNRLLLCSLHGPWAASGLPTPIRVTITFPPDYPDKPLNIDVSRTMAVSNKLRAKLITGVRGIAARYAIKQRGAIEACLVSLLGGKVAEPEDSDHRESSDDGQMLIGALFGDEDIDVDNNTKDPARILANRSCPLPRRCGAVFDVHGNLFSFHPNPTYGPVIHQRGRSRSPAPDIRHKPRRRRMFESFGVVPAIDPSSDRQARRATELEDHDSDSDEILNIPSLLVRARRYSPARSDSVQTDSQIWPGQASLTRGVHNSRIHVTNVSSLAPSHRDFLRATRVQSDILKNVKLYEQLSHSTSLPWLVQHLWHSLLTQLQPQYQSRASVLNAPALIGNKVTEQFVLDVTAVLALEGDIVTLGLLACVIQLDIQKTNLQYTHKPRRRVLPKADHSTSHDVDYFSLQPRSRTRSDTKSGYSGDAPRATTPGGAHNLPLKSPQYALLATSYGTQTSSQGSSGRGSSWALSAFFRSSSSVSLVNRRDAPEHTPPLTSTHSGHTSPSSPGLPKRSPVVTTQEKVTAKSASQPQKQRQSTHVSFATEVATPQEVSEVTQRNASIEKRHAKVVVRTLSSKVATSQDSVFITPSKSAQLVASRMSLANLLDRMQLPLLRTEVIKIGAGTKPLKYAGHNNLTAETGIQFAVGRECPLALHLACIDCGSLPTGTAPPYCTTCRTHCKPVLCSICQLPLSGLIDVCRSCLHATHIVCMQEWRETEMYCPTACGCQCAL